MSETNELSLLTIDFDAEARKISNAEHEKAKTQLLRAKAEFVKTHDANRTLAVFDKYMYQRIKSQADSYIHGTNQFFVDLFNSNTEFAAAMFRASSTRTGFHENLQFSTIREQSKTVNGLQRLPKNGSNAIRLPGYDKSIDFIGNATGTSNKHYRFLFCAKYTKGDGGSQDNQRHDLESFARAAPSLHEKSNNDILVLLADGEHYQKSRGTYGDVSFIEYWQRQSFGKRLVVSDTSHFDIEMAKLLSKL